MSKYSDMAERILEKVGGKDNVSQLSHCVTRLRFILKDRSKLDEAGLKKVKGVMSIQWVGEQMQLVVGQTVEEIYDALCSLGGFKREAAIDENLDGDLVKQKLTLKQVPGAMLRTLQNCVFPIIPIIIPAGLCSLFASMLGPNLFNILPADHDLITLFTFVGNAGMYFIPIFMAWSAAKYFNTSIPCALFLGAVLVHPTLLQMVTDGTAFTVYGIPMTPVTYTNQFLPSIVSVWIMGYVYSFLRKHMPESLRYAFLPLFTILIMLPITLCAIGPLTTLIGNGISAVATWVANVAGPIAIGLIAGLWYLLVAFGLDKAITPIVMQNFGSLGYDNLFWCSAVFGTYALIGVALASVVRWKGERRSLAVTNAVTIALGGVSEPTLYASVLPYKVNMAALVIGGFVGGLIGGIFGCKAWVIGTGNILFAAVFAGGDASTVVPGVLACAVALVVSFTISFVGYKFVKDDAAEDEEELSEAV